MSAISAEALIGRHAALWQGDPWYRLAWLVWPQLASLLCAGWVLIGASSSAPVHETATSWAKPVSLQAQAAQTDALRNQSETDPQAFDRLRQLANGGDAMAQFSMATLYDPDFNVSKLTQPDINTALTWYEKAAEHGNANAEEVLGVKYYEGRWVPVDYAKAIFWLEKSAAQGNRLAERMMGVANATGNGVPVNRTQSLEWFKRAADHGDVIGEVQIADAYATGRRLCQKPAGSFELVPKSRSAKQPLCTNARRRSLSQWRCRRR